MIGTFCRSCRTISKVFNDRCAYCGSQHIEVKSFDDKLVKHEYSSGRDFIEESRSDGKRQTRSQAKKTQI